MFLNRIRTIRDDMHESTPCLGCYHWMTLHDMLCARCHQEVRVPILLPRALADTRTPTGHSSRRVLVWSAETIEKLNKHLHAVFPHSTRPFGRLNIVLSGDPAQLAPVRALYPIRLPRPHASITNGSPPLRFLTYVRVAVTTTMTANAPTMKTPQIPQTTQVQSTFAASRRDEDRRERRWPNARWLGENNVCSLFSQLSSAHCPTQPPHPCIPTAIVPALSVTGTSLLPDVDLSIVPPKADN